MSKKIIYYLRRFWWQLVADMTPMTGLILIANLVVFGFQLVWFFYYRSAWFTETFALSTQGLEEARYWQVFTYAWLHAETFPPHLIFNLLFVSFLGRQLEFPLGRKRFFLLYVGGALSAALAWIVSTPSPNEGLVVGASGSVFALLAAFAAYDPKRVLKVWLFMVVPFRVSVRRLTFFLVLSELLLWWGNFLPNIAHAAHLGGALFGWAIMKAWRVRAGQFYPVDGPVKRL
jgi:membrane associated rhomboid family serine protease